MIPAGIIGVGKAVPDKIMNNHDFVALGLDTSDEWIRERTGIIERRIADENITTSDLALDASKQAIKMAQITAKDLDLIIVATTSGDYPVFPSTASLLQHKLGANCVGAFDVSAACTGFTYALTISSQFINTGFAKNVLVVGVDCLSKFVNWKDRGTCILFGDGAGAVVVSKVEKNYGILANDLNANGADGDILMVKKGGAKDPLTYDTKISEDHFIYMNGKAVFKLAVNRIMPTLDKALKKANLSRKDVDFFIPHQANSRIIEMVRQKLGLSKEQVFVNIQKYGNTSAGSIPIALEEAVALKRIKKGDIVAFVGFGAGFTWGANIIRWAI